MDQLPPTKGGREQVLVVSNLPSVEGREQLLAITNLVMMSDSKNDDVLFIRRAKRDYQIVHQKGLHQCNDQSLQMDER